MQKIIIDTNVLVSALIQKSYPFLIINDLFTEQKTELCISDDIIREYIEVLSRKRFTQYSEFALKAKLVLTDIEANAKIYTPVVKVRIIKDISDNKFLELAETCKAGFIITGNINDFTMKSYKKTKIVSPKDYWENYRP